VSTTTTTNEVITLNVADGSMMNAYVARPRDSARAPGLLVFQEAFGVNAHIRSVADRFAALGFVAVAPELYHRSAAGYEGSYTDFASVMPHMQALTNEGLEADIDASYQWLAGQSGADSSRIACIGFCMGGRVSYMANARVKLSAAVSFYGGRIAPDLLPLASKQHAPILMFWGGLDTHIPAEQYRAVADALTEAKAVHEQVIFGQADHGFFCDARESYNDIAARQALALVKEFFAVYGVL
jgi:carboxymethylenebutenolidase